MLPGFRFLFAAVVLSMSTLTFGIGAAALLRSAHEKFVSLPTRTQKQVFALQVDAARPMLAMLVVDAPAPDQKGSAQSAVTNAPLAARSEEQPPEVASTSAEPSGISAEPDQVVALTAVVPSEEKSRPSETPKPGVNSIDTPPQADLLATADMPSPATPAAPAPSMANDSAVAALEQASAPTEDAASLASTNIATLGGPPATI